MGHIKTVHRKKKSVKKSIRKHKTIRSKRRNRSARRKLRGG